MRRLWRQRRRATLPNAFAGAAFAAALLSVLVALSLAVAVRPVPAVTLQ